MDGILSATGHIGNSDIVSDYVFEDNEELVDTISALKHMDDVDPFCGLNKSSRFLFYMKSQSKVL
jgi:hypothetical protein